MGDRQGEPLVRFHGVTGDAGVHQRLADERRGVRHVLAFDFRGRGRSCWEPPWTFATQVADLAETSAALWLLAADWLGHSYGGSWYSSSKLAATRCRVTSHECDVLLEELAFYAWDEGGPRDVQNGLAYSAHELGDDEQASLRVAFEGRGTDNLRPAGIVRLHAGLAGDIPGHRFR